MRDAAGPAVGEMREIELDDDSWYAAIAALVSDEPASGLRERWPAYAEFLGELAAHAARDPVLVGMRLATHGRNPRLFALLTGAFLARSGFPTLVLDLSPDTRWLEQLVGADFKEGLVDHLRFGVPLERCIRATGFERLSAMSGGAWFMAGSPLDDAPGFRAALERLRHLHRAVVVTLPPPLEAGDRTGIGALCDAVVTVEERAGVAPLAGSERAVVRLVGDPEAARDLAQLAHRFLGPLPGVLAALAQMRGGTRSVARAAEPWTSAEFAEAAPTFGEAPPTPETSSVEDLAFLRRFEGPSLADPATGGERAPAAHGPATGEPRIRRSREGSRRRKAVFTTALALSILAAAAFSLRAVVDDVRAWIFGEPTDDLAYEEVGGSQMISLDPAPVAPAVELPADDAAAPVDSTAAAADSPGPPADSIGAPPAPSPEPRGQPIPFSVHVGSYQSVESGMRVVDRLATMGHVATLAPVTIPGKGLWYRVYVGAFADSTAAGRLRDRLQSSEVVEEGVVRPTPWTFEIGIYPSREAARDDIEALRDEGIAVYLVGDAPARLYAGAYRSREEAEPLARELRAALGDRTATLTLREE